MQKKANPRARRRPVARHPGIYYRPRAGGRVGPPYEIAYLDSTGKRRWAVVHSSLEDAEAKRAELRLRRRRGERNQPVRKNFEQYAWEWLELPACRERTREVHSLALRHPRSSSHSQAYRSEEHTSALQSPHHLVFR